MAYGPVSISGVSKKARERMMYMDGKLVWSAAMGASGEMSATVPDTVDYIVVKPMSTGANTPLKDARIVRGGSGNVAWWQASSGAGSSAAYRYGKVTFSQDGKISISYPADRNYEFCTVEGYHYY